MTPLEALEALARDARGSDYADEREQSEWFGIVDDALAALSPRVVTTAEELDTLPAGTVILDQDSGTVLEAEDYLEQDAPTREWVGIGRPFSTSSGDLLDDVPTWIVAWTPQSDPNPLPLGH